ncbi:hypothetical protein DFH08DRAFT_803320 [Mycena albidolilacea]|uniref:Uncharacterized protein n=1 Tax=Mycena albidolilacea TaxID=1033008 RepID=A0AAD7ACM0_9AGAR|nr:hypothetical protein DFH08DRAFT_803320 [Mycena albidolilacea]
MKKEDDERRGKEDETGRTKRIQPRIFGFRTLPVRWQKNEQIVFTVSHKLNQNPKKKVYKPFKHFINRNIFYKKAKHKIRDSRKLFWGQHFEVSGRCIEQQSRRGQNMSQSGNINGTSPISGRVADVADLQSQLVIMAEHHR